MPEDKQQSRVVVAAIALTFLLAGAGAGAWGMHVWWQRHVAAPNGQAGHKGESGGDKDSADPPAAPVRVGTARREAVRPEKLLVGRLHEIHRTTIGSEVEGKVLAVNVENGSPIEAGKTVLASIDKTWLRLSKLKQQARIEVIDAQLRKEKANLARLEKLRQGKLATEREYSDQLAEYEQRVAELKEAQAALENLTEQWKRLDITAPFSGWVIQRHVEAGQWLSPGAPVADIVSRGRIYAEMNVPESLVNGLELGMPIDVTVNALGRTFPGKIATITPYGATASRTYPVRVELSDQNGLLMVGMSTTAVFPAGLSRKQITVSRDAVLIKPDGATVWVACPGEPMTASPVPVKVVTRVGDRYAVEPLDGAGRDLLKHGARVVLEGAERLRPGQAIRKMDRDLANAKWLGESTATRPADPTTRRAGASTGAPR